MTADPRYQVQPVAGIASPITWACPGEAFDAGRIPRLTLPDPPANAFALRVTADYSRHRVRSTLTLHGTDPDSGRPRSVSVHPATFPARLYHVFPLRGRLTLTPGGPIDDIALTEFEWLIADPNP